ncbi:hypothetical protein BC834DRAFT_968281 [Gloeopeniophorella convolvens]|nr:hypothetical protein BC834DRAFT_968281 [Gloeopeniophorella convolvens]
MQPCPGFPARAQLASHSRRIAHNLLGSRTHHALSAKAIRFHATAAALAQKTPSATPAQTAPPAVAPNKLQHAQALTALHTARELIPRILPPQSPELSFWNGVLRDVSEETSRASLTSQGDNVTVVVYPVDEFAEGEELVTALLQDPFSSEEDNARIVKRWEGRERDTRLDIEYSPPPETPKQPSEGALEETLNPPSHVLRVSSSLLTSSSPSVRLIELRPGHQLFYDYLRLLYTAHIPIVLLNPLTTPLASLAPPATPTTQPTKLPFPLPPHALLLITSPSPASVSTIASTVVPLGIDPARVLLVDPSRALSAFRALRTNSSDALHVQRFADDALGSGLSALRARLHPAPTLTQRASAVVRATTAALHARLRAAEADAHDAAGAVHALRDEAARARTDAQCAAFGTGTGTGPANRVRAALAEADSAVLPALAALPWWRVLWAPDDAGWRVRHATRDARVAHIDAGLLPALAPLPAVQARLVRRALERAEALPPSVRSHVLLNALQQRAGAPGFALRADALLAPVARRLAQLDGGATTGLARAAQDLVLRVAGALGAGVGAGALVLSQGVGEAVGAGLLVGVLGLRWAIGKWDRVRRGWTADWVRVKEAAERDVQAALNEALAKQVLAVPVQAADGIEELVAKRRDEIEQLRQEVDKLEARVNTDSQSPS